MGASSGLFSVPLVQNAVSKLKGRYQGTKVPVKRRGATARKA